MSRRPDEQTPASAEAASETGEAVVEPAVLAVHRARRAEARAQELSARVEALESELERGESRPLRELTMALRRAEQRALAAELAGLEAAADAAVPLRDGLAALEALNGLIEGACRQVELLLEGLEVLRRDVLESEQDGAVERARAARQPLAPAERGMQAAEHALVAVVLRPPDGRVPPPRRSAPVAPAALTALLAAERRMATNRGPAGGAAGVGEVPVGPALAPVPAAVLAPSAAAAPLAPGPDPARLDAAMTRLRAGHPAPPARPSAAALPTPSRALPATGPALRPGADPAPGRSRLPRALRALARRDAAAAGRVLWALLPLQHRVEGEFWYELAVRELGRVAVLPRRDVTNVLPVLPGEMLVELTIETDLAGLARLSLGRPFARALARRRAALHGRRRPLGSLRRLARAPHSFADMAAAGIVLEPAVALAWLALAVDPEWTRGHRFTVAFLPAGGAGDASHEAVHVDGALYLRADDGRALTCSAEPPRDAPAVEVTCAPDRLGALLAGMPARRGAPEARGDLGALALLQAWAQGRPGAGRLRWG